MHQLLRITVLMISVAAGTALAQQGQPAQPAPSQPTVSDPMAAERQRMQNLMSMWNPQTMIDQSVKQAVTRYKLTPEQEQLARKMTTDGVNAFLDKHEAEIRGLVRDFIQARMSSNPPTPEQAQEWSKRLAPLFEEGKQEILKGNQEFREVLNDEQKKAFDADQKVLQQQIDQSQERLARWTDGKFNPQTDWFNQRRKAETTRPGQPELDRWDLYVRGFINRYKLDPGQTTEAMSILEDSRNRATEYYYSRKSDIETANQQLKDLLADPAQRDQVPPARKRLEELNAPIDSLYAQMQERLNQLPTDEQRKNHEAEQMARRERWRDRMTQSAGDTALSATSQSQPAATQSLDTRPATTRPGRGVASTRPARIRGPRTATQPAATQPVADTK